MIQPVSKAKQFLLWPLTGPRTRNLQTQCRPEAWHHFLWKEAPQPHPSLLGERPDQASWLLRGHEEHLLSIMSSPQAKQEDSLQEGF